MCSSLLRLLITVLIVCVAGSTASPQRPKQDDETVFSDQVASRVLDQLRAGLEGHSLSDLLAVFDRDKMDSFPSFRDQLQSMFQQFESFRVHYKIAETSTEGTRGIVLVNFQMEQTPSDENSPPVRKSSQMRFEIERSPKGWKIVKIEPRGFLS